MIHTLLSLRLSEESVLVDSAHDAPSAIAAAQTLRPDLLLLDLDPTGFDALQLCYELKQNAQTRDIPIIFLTPATDPAERTKLLEAGAIDYITKPFDLPEFQARVRGALKTSYLLDLLSKKAMID